MPIFQAKSLMGNGKAVLNRCMLLSWATGDQNGSCTSASVCCGCRMVGRHGAGTVRRPARAAGLLTRRGALTVGLVDGQETPQVVLIHWPTKATAVRRPAAYGGAAAKAMRLLANADVELARLRRIRERSKVERS